MEKNKSLGNSIIWSVAIGMTIVTPIIIASPFFFTDFMCRYYCTGKKTTLAIASVASNVGIMIAYFGIPFAIWRAKVMLDTIKLRGGVLSTLFMLFILLCGLTHGLQALAWIHAYYYLMAYIEFWTAVFSLFTLYKATEYIIKAFAEQQEEAKKLKEENEYIKGMLSKHGITLSE